LQRTTQNTRRWWRTPRRLSEREEERRVTFLELFYDLVYVVVVAEIGHYLAGHITVAGLAQAAFLFVLIWVAWLNGSIYHDLHGQNDLRSRFFTFAQMFTVAGMAVFAHSAFGVGATGFALSVAAYQVLLGYLWWRTGVHDPNHRPLSQPYAQSFLVSILLFAGSLFAPEGWNVTMWALGLLLVVLLPLRLLVMRPSDSSVRVQLERSLEIGPSAVERFDQFTIIVLGEVIVAVVRGVAEHERLDWTVVSTAGLGMLIAIGLWWVYFDIVAQRIPQRSRRAVFAWLYLHLPATLGIVAVGAATLNVVEHAGEPLAAGVRWLLVGASALTLCSIALLIPAIQVPERQRPFFGRAAAITAGAGLAAIMLGVPNLSTIQLLLGLNALLLAPVLSIVSVWISAFGAEEIARN
jgi:low temperature requirement protein LtrA